MKPVERIEKLIKARRYKASAETYDKTLGSFLQAVDEHLEQKSAPTEPKMWRIIMKSRITKLAAAAVIIIAAYVVIDQSGGSIDISTVTFAQITENMKQMPWMHVVGEGAGDKVEAWFGFERRIVAQKHSDGRISYEDELNQIGQDYNPDANTITVSHGSRDSLSGMRSVLDYPKFLMKMVEDAGLKVIQETGKYKGKDVKIFKMSGFMGGMDMKVEMTVGAERNVLLFINQKAFDKAGKVTIEANAHYDYPETGPESIYDVGVPRSAKVVSSEKERDKAFKEAISAVDNRENWPEPRALAIAYWQARTAKDYDEMAVLWPGSASWDRHAIENEKPVEYVFGEVNKEWAPDHIFVPYASKGYYDEHGKYSLKMVMSKRKSAKKRFYIVSANWSPDSKLGVLLLL